MIMHPVPLGKMVVWLKMSSERTEKMDAKIRALAAGDAERAIRKILGTKPEVAFSEVLREVEEHVGDYPYIACYEVMGQKAAINKVREKMGLHPGRNPEGRVTIRTTPAPVEEVPQKVEAKGLELEIPKTLTYTRTEDTRGSMLPDNLDLLMRSIDKNGAANIKALEGIRENYATLEKAIRDNTQQMKDLHNTILVMSNSVHKQLGEVDEHLIEISTTLDKIRRGEKDSSAFTLLSQVTGAVKKHTEP
jgi:hypothetical protein